MIVDVDDVAAVDGGAVVGAPACSAGTWSGRRAPR